MNSEWKFTYMDFVEIVFNNKMFTGTNKLLQKFLRFFQLIKNFYLLDYLKITDLIKKII